MNHRSDKAVQMVTLTARPDAKCNAGLSGWASKAGAWSFASTKLVNSSNRPAHYTPAGGVLAMTGEHPVG
ncbi:hypothetical protein ACLGI4_05985 [Streptomyces sp. HMX112]|uniref:hypothetical protein n=1 Tax=Streptomyces sp. HMX112 TaxID=3390850 RepID=UPI003A7FFDC9